MSIEYAIMGATGTNPKDSTGSEATGHISDRFRICIEYSNRTDSGRMGKSFRYGSFLTGKTDQFEG